MVATLSLVISATALMFLAQSDVRHPGFLVPFALAVLGLTLSIGLTASSIAIMGSVDGGKGGAAGALETTGYELGITLFGVFMSSAFSRTIGDAYIVASELPGEQGAASIEAGKTAFTQTHAILLTAASVVITALAVVVFFTLSGYRSLSRAHH